MLGYVEICHPPSKDEGQVQTKNSESSETKQ